MLQKLPCFSSFVSSLPHFFHSSDQKSDSASRWFSAVEEKSVQFDRQEFLKEPFAQFLIKSKVISFSDLNEMKRGDLQKLDLAFELGWFQSENPKTKQEILNHSLDELMELKDSQFQRDKSSPFDLMQRQCLKESAAVQKLYQEGRLSESDICSMDIDDFAKFELESICNYFSEGTLTLDQIKGCSYALCICVDNGKFDIKDVFFYTEREGVSE